uniref:Uncharacterized protein n=1 Tax=Oryza barthii TaxID=65489 RepID=A0A0D3FH93_9ORYZ
MSPSVCPTRRAGPVAGQPLPGRTPDAEVGQPQQQPALLVLNHRHICWLQQQYCSKAAARRTSLF